MKMSKRVLTYTDKHSVRPSSRHPTVPYSNAQSPTTFVVTEKKVGSFTSANTDSSTPICTFLPNNACFSISQEGQSPDRTIQLIRVAF